jgi:FtsZ-binding cell division protein ZapB
MEITPEQEDKLEAWVEQWVSSELLDIVCEELYKKPYRSLTKEEQDVADQGVDVVRDAIWSDGD